MNDKTKVEYSACISPKSIACIGYTHCFLCRFTVSYLICGEHRIYQCQDRYFWCGRVWG